jgi:hypothetical protein
MTNATRAAMDQHDLSGPQLTVPKQSLPGSLSRQRNCGRMCMIDFSRLAGDRRFIEHDLVGIPAAADTYHAHHDALDFVAALRSRLRRRE